MAFKEQDDTNKDKQNEDSFGLPDLDYKPLDKLEEKTEQVVSSEETQSSSAEGNELSSSTETIEKEEVRSTYIPQEEPKSKAPAIIGIIIAVVIALTAFLIYQYVIKPSSDKAKKEQLAKEAEKERLDKEKAERLRKEEEERKRREAEEAAAKQKPAEGAIELLTAPTGRYYVVVASAVDADLVMDYAKKLSAKGVGSKIIPPFGKSKFSRITISDHDSFAAGQVAADAAKAEYGNAVWVIKY